MNNLWQNDKIQFARLISEAETCGLFTKNAYKKLAKEMDLEPDYISELIDRAQMTFQESKRKIFPK